MIEIRLDEIINKKNLMRAWGKVCNKNSMPGIDKISIDKFSKNLDENINKLIFEIKNNLYTPIPVKIIDNDKKIAIVSIRDKLIQSAIVNVISSIVKEMSVETNFGYIEGRSVYQAVDYINNTICKKRINYFYKCDINHFFDNINHNILIDKILKLTGSEEVTNLIKTIIKVQIYDNDKLTYKENGIILGSPISPLLSNIYLYETDKIFYLCTSLYVRYSDDILIGYKQLPSAYDIEYIKNELEKVKLSINNEKSGIKDLKRGFTYLGYDFGKSNIDTLTTGSTLLLLNDIKQNDCKNIFKYLEDMDDIQDIDITCVFEGIKENGDKKYFVIFLIIIVRNDIEIPQNYKEYIQAVLEINCLDDLEDIIRKSGKDIYSLLSKIVQFFIMKNQYALAEELNKINIFNEEAIIDDEIKQEYKNKYLSLFCGEKGIYSRGYADVNNVRHYYKINMNFSAIELDKMLKDKYSIGIYPVTNENMCKFFVFDIDISKKVLIEHGENRVVCNNLLKNAKKLAFEIKEILKNAEIESYIEFSGYKGYHVWIFFKEFIEVDIIYNKMKKLTEHIIMPNAINIEFIPSMYSDDEEIIKIPFSYHELTNTQSLFIEAQENDINTQFEYVYNIVENDRCIIERISQKNGEDKKVLCDRKCKYTKISDFPEYITSIYKKCNLIQQIVNKSINENYINHFERNALLYVFGHCGNVGREFIHFVISKCLNYTFEVTEGFIARIKEKPVSCQKLMNRFKQYSYKCKCTFEEYPLFYASPVIHGYILNSKEVTRPDYVDKGLRAAQISKVNEEIKINTITCRLIELTKQKKKIEKELKICCEELEVIFSNRKVDEYEVDIGKLIKKNGEWYLKVI